MCAGGQSGTNMLRSGPELPSQGASPPSLEGRVEEPSSHAGRKIYLILKRQRDILLRSYGHILCDM